MFMYTSSRGKSNCSHSKSEFQMFSLISGRQFVGVPNGRTVIWCLHTELYKFPCNLLTNNSRTVCPTALRLEEIV